MSFREYATPFAMLHAASLLSHRSRIRKFHEAVHKVVKNDDYVIDIGTGSGILAILAAKQGARVTAIDVNRESLTYAKHAARKNGVEENIEFVHSHFADFSPVEHADVVMCEMLSSFMLVEQQIAASNYAVENLLKPSGRIIPEEVSIYTCPVQNDILWERFEIEGLSFPRVIQTAEQGQNTDLADLSELAVFDLRIPNPDAIVDKQLKFTFVQSGTVHGFAGMFEARLMDDLILTMEDGWKELFMPLVKPIEAKTSKSLIVRVSFRPGEFDSLVLEILQD
ncbi:MAG: 50S ribosomal protein L11 methyltransferase [Candidatus Thorarchaeota archaeon]|nr:50S ribosomal protein L11 methyltransferase [Candidatus Thorarchaeota archaeon]